jgi:DNA-cytosine methyltransferase
VTSPSGTLAAVSEPASAVILSLCSGYGGLDEAVAAATGAPVVAHVEYDADASKVLEHRYPGIPNYGDLTSLDWERVVAECVPAGRDVIVCGGYPCQPFSSAGKRRGTDDHRHLWPYIADGLRRIRPRLVVFENVRNHLNLGFDVVLAGLAELGYDVTWTLIKASDVGAPHGRARLFIIGRQKGYEAPDRVPIAVVDGEGGWMEPSDGLFGTIEWKPGKGRKIPVTGRVAEGGMYPLVLPELTEAAERADAEEDESDGEDVLPTPRGATARTSRKALTADGQWSAPSLEQAVELAKGELPREYESWDEVRGRSAGMQMFPTPTARLGEEHGTPNVQTAQARMDAGRRNLDDSVALLPTPEAKLSDSGPDYARANREGSGGDDLTTTVFRAFVNDGADPDRVLPTPTARLGDGRGASHPDRRRELRGERSGELDEVAVHELGEARNLPTPTARDGKGANQRGDDSCLHGALLPSPVASDAERTTDSYGRGNPTLQGALLPTPEASDGTGGRVASERGGSRPSGAKRAVTLATAVHHDLTESIEDAGLLPTPTGALGEGGQTSRSGDRKDEPLLPGIAQAAADGTLLPTPTASIYGTNQSPTPGAAVRPSLHTLTYGEDAVLGADGELLPTPRASDGEKGSPNQHGSSGDLMLVPAVLSLLPPEDTGRWERDPATGARLLPSPVAQDAAGARNDTAYRDADAGPHNSGTTLTDVMWLAAGHEPGSKEAPDYAPVTQWGPYEGAIRRWEAITREAPAPTEAGPKGKQRLAPPFPEWMMGLPAGWVTDVPGISRNAKLKILGNGVVPQQAVVAVVRLLALAPW